MIRYFSLQALIFISFFLVTVTNIPHTYAGNPVTRTRGETATLTWNVAGALFCTPSYSGTQYPDNSASGDTLATQWASTNDVSGSISSPVYGNSAQSFPQSYTFKCAADSTHFDTATLTINDCSGATPTWNGTACVASGGGSTPTASLSATPRGGNNGDTFTYTISSSGATSCSTTQNPGGTVVSSLMNDSLSAQTSTGDWTFTTTCTNASGSTSTSAQVTVCDGTTTTWNGSSCVAVAPSITCGSSDQTVTSSAPVSGLCSSGSASSVTTNASTYDWTCNSGSLSCQAYRQASCGTSNGQSFASAPSSNLCTIGTPSSVTTSASNYTWTCAGGGTSNTASCSATRPPTSTCSSKLVLWGTGANLDRCMSLSGVTNDTQSTASLRNDTTYSAGQDGYASFTCNATTDTYTVNPGSTCFSFTCPAGQYDPGTYSCSTCPANSYCPGDYKKYDCPTNYTSPSGSTSVGQCIAPSSGSCGTAHNGSPVSSQPTNASERCSSGAYSDTSDSGGYFRWSCDSASCQVAQLCGSTQYWDGSSCASCGATGCGGCLASVLSPYNSCTCNNGGTVPTCVTSGNNCPSQLINWGTSCLGTIAATTNGASNSVTNTQSGYTGSATFICSNGTYGVTSQSCTQDNSGTCSNGATNYPTCDFCPIHTYYSGGSCYSCPANSSAPAGSVGVGSCTCTSGYSMSGGVCVQDQGIYVSATDRTNITPGSTITIGYSITTDSMIEVWCRLLDNNGATLHNWSYFGTGYGSLGQKNYTVTIPGASGAYLYRGECRNNSNQTQSSGADLTVYTTGLYPDLSAGAVSPSSAITGNATTFAATISNGGLVSTGASFDTFFQYSTLPNGGGTVTDIPSVTVSTLGASASAQASKSYTFSSPGTYYMRACADKANSSDTGSIDEGSNEGNNCSPTWTTVTVSAASPDLIASPVLKQGSATLPITTSVNQSTNLTTTLTNQGTAGTGASFPVFYQVATGDSGSGTVTDYALVNNHQAMNAGQSLSISFTHTFTGSAVQSIRVCGDKLNSGNSGVITESDETNNCSVWSTVNVSGGSGVCTEGNYDNGGVCTPCPLGNYCTGFDPPTLCLANTYCDGGNTPPGGTSKPPVACPNGTTAPAGSGSAASCVCPSGYTYDTTNSVCANPQVVSAVVSGDYYYTSPEAITLTCSNSLKYSVYKDGTAYVATSTYSGVTSIPVAVTGNYKVYCIHGSVSDSVTKSYHSPPPDGATVSVEAYPKTITSGGKSTISWSIANPSITAPFCTISAAAVCTNGVCTTPTSAGTNGGRDTQHEAKEDQTTAINRIKTILASGYTDDGRPIANAVKYIATGQTGSGAKAIGKKTLQISYTTDFTVDCGNGKRATARVRIANSNEQ